MIIQKFKKVALRDNNYVVIDEDSLEAIIIDCTENPQDMLDYIKNQNAHLKYILLTHGHFDHILGLHELSDENIQKTYLHKEDKFLLDNIDEFTDFLSLPPITVPRVNHFLDEKTTLSLGKNPIQIISTPGHTPGSVCFLIQNNLFSGDTIFYQTYGRTDLPKSSAADMQKSLKKLFSFLPDETLIFPGHGHSTTIGQEKKHYHI